MNKTFLVILDGWGIAENPKVSAIHHANIDYYWHLWSTYPHTVLEASGRAVGLPEGQMGNSEVGHMNLGAGRTVYQELEQISLNFQNPNIHKNTSLQNLINYCTTNQKPLHLLGLLSDGGVHSHIGHLFQILQFFQNYNLPSIFVHAFLDGRDTDPKSGITHVQNLINFLKDLPNAQLASIIGRYYAMDRDKRWERIAKAYHLLTKAQGTPTSQPLLTIQQFYDKGITDEFMEPIWVSENNQPTATIQPQDAVLFFNFRTDRGRELTTVLSQQDFPEHHMHKLPLHFVTLTQYDPNFKNVHIVFPKENVSNTLGEVLAAHNKKQIRIAETEKYPHVTFFFNGGKEEPFPNEKRILCPSPKVATYDLMPEMSAFQITEQILPEIHHAEADFICLNFANPDMVGHTGVWDAAIKACETVSICLEKIIPVALQNHYNTIILSDHGNVDKMKNEDGTPHTAHTTAVVPCIFVSNNPLKILQNQGKLGDIAPTLLHLMNLPIPQEMNGNILAKFC